MRKILMLSAVFALALSACKKDKKDPLPADATIFEVTRDLSGNVAVKITDRGRGIGTRTLYKDTVYILDNKVFVNEGQVLTIQPGTVIKGEVGTGEAASALIVARGGKIIAKGTASQPIIFTTIADNVNNPTDVQADVRGLWGGLIILGKATINDPTGQSAIEGIPTSETRGLYGGSDDNDNSGELSYISVRHGGAEIGAGNEINGITFGAVGAGTRVDHLEVIANFDDGYEFFGGTVSAKYLISAYCNDDAYDWDQGFRGKLQYLVTIQKPNEGGRGFEANGVVNDAPFNYDQTPRSIPLVANGTFIGHGRNSGDRQAVILRQNSGGKFYNSIFYNFAAGIVIDNVKPSEPIESETRLDEGDIVFANNLFSKIGSATDLGGVGADSPGNTAAKITTHLQNNNNVYNNTPGLKSLTVGPETKGLDLGLTTGGAADNVPAFNVRSLDTFFDAVNKIGAFVDGTNWMKGWTALDTYGFLKE
jgi:hypothetical protein